MNQRTQLSTVYPLFNCILCVFVFFLSLPKLRVVQDRLYNAELTAVNDRI